jgi:8-oxo-dGTP pyrophosphatase MutT (NUDIX family)
MIDTKKMATKPQMASTVILIREHDRELQVYLLKRSTMSGFFPETYVFPGGRVETEDQASGLWKVHVDLDSEVISQRFGGSLTEEEALTYGVTAIRETFEEAGVLLAYRNEYTQENLERVQDRRKVEELPKGWLNDLVVSEGWMLAFSRLSRWAHWITPEGMPKRYETRFFLVFMHPGQECNPDARETTHGIWVSPEKGLVKNLQGEIPLSPPTLVTLHELLLYSDMRDLKKEVQARTWGEALLPRMFNLPKGKLILEPWDPMSKKELEIDTIGLKMNCLPAGEPFSRLWYNGGIWRPVGN